MNGTLTEARAVAAERREVVELAREIACLELAPRALALDQPIPAVLEEAWGRITEVGFDRALLDEEHGGPGLPADSFLACLEQLATGDAGVAMLALLSSAALAALPAQLADETGRWALIPAPRSPLSVAAGIRSTRGDETLVDGEVPVALGALGAEGLVVLGPESTIFAVPAAIPGVACEAAGPQSGLRAATAARVSFAGARATAAPPPEEEPLVAARSQALLWAGSAAIARGISRRAQDLAREYAEARRQGGVRIIEHDAVAQLLVEMAVRLEATREPSLGTASELSALALRIAATDAAVATATDAVQVFGGTGYVYETGVEKLMRDAKWLQAWPLPNWVVREEIAGRFR